MIRSYTLRESLALKDAVIQSTDALDIRELNRLAAYCSINSQQDNRLAVSHGGRAAEVYRRGVTGHRQRCEELTGEGARMHAEAGGASLEAKLAHEMRGSHGQRQNMIPVYNRHMRTMAMD